MIVEAAAGLSSLKAAIDIVRGMKDIGDATTVNLAIFPLLNELIATQQGYFTLLRVSDDQEKKIAAFENWEAEKQRYELVSLGETGRALAYRTKPAMQGSEPVHCICASCYAKGVKSILQTESWQPMRCQVEVCYTCAAVLYTSGNPHADHAALKPKPRH